MTSADILVQTAGYGYHPHADEDDYDEQEDEQEDDEHDDIEAEFDELLEAQVRNDIIQEDEEEDDDDDEEEEYRVGRHHDHGQPATFVPQFRPGMPLPMTASVDSEIFHVKSKIAHIMGLLNQEGNLTGEEAAAVERLRELAESATQNIVALPAPVALLDPQTSVPPAVSFPTYPEPDAFPMLVAAALAAQPGPHKNLIPEPEVESGETDGIVRRRRKPKERYRCPNVDCDKTFTRKFNLQVHMKTHDPERPRPFLCPVCQQGFSRQVDCIRHTETHVQKKHTCVECNKVFSRKDALKRHITTGRCMQTALLPSLSDFASPTSIEDLHLAASLAAQEQVQRLQQQRQQHPAPSALDALAAFAEVERNALSQASSGGLSHGGDDEMRDTTALHTASSLVGLSAPLAHTNLALPPQPGSLEEAVTAAIAAADVTTAEGVRTQPRASFAQYNRLLEQTPRTAVSGQYS